MPCTYCGRVMSMLPSSGRAAKPTKDHVWPRSRFGSAGLQPHQVTVDACAKCNCDKGNWTPYEWLQVLLRNKDERYLRVWAFCSRLNFFGRERVPGRCGSCAASLVVVRDVVHCSDCSLISKGVIR